MVEGQPVCACVSGYVPQGETCVLSVPDHIYAFTCNPGGGATDCRVSLSDAAGQVLAVDNNGGTGFIVYELQDLGLDDHADTFSGATVLTPGTATSGNLELSGDVDFFEVSLAASTAHSVTTTGISTTLTVYAPDKTTVISTGASPRAFTSNAAGGAHYVRVSGSTTGVYAEAARPSAVRGPLLRRALARFAANWAVVLFNRSTRIYR